MLFIVHYNSWDDLNEMIASLNKLEYIPDILVYDNSSNENKIDLIKNNNLQINIDYIQGEANVGYTGALKSYLYNNNFCYDAVVVSNADILFLDNEVFRNFSIILKNKDVGLIGPRIIDKKSSAELNHRQR